MGNYELRMGNGELRMGNGEWGMGNGEWGEKNHRPWFENQSRVNHCFGSTVITEDRDDG